VVDQDGLDLAAIVAVDRAGRIQAGDAVVQRQARTRPHLRFHAQRQFDGDAGGNRQPRAGLQFDIRIDGGQQVEPRRTWRGVMGQRQVRAVG
jgi:hypothetical protein